MYTKKKPLLLAHRGYTKKFQENTYESYFESLFDTRIDGIEIDVCQTSDKQLVCFHDINLKRLFDIDKNINQIEFKDLKDLPIKKELLYGKNLVSYKYNTKIVLFTRLLNMFKYQKKIINIELKIEEDDKEFVNNVINEIRIRNMENNVILTSYNHKLLEYIDKEQFKIGSINDYDICQNDINKMNLQYPIIILDKRTDKDVLKKLKEMNKIIGVYTLNSYNDNKLDNFNNFDVDYLIFDRLN